MPFDNLPQKSSRVIELLRDAKARIGYPYLWSQGTSSRPPNRVCLVQSVMITCGVPGRRSREPENEKLLIRLLANELPLFYRLLPLSRRQKLIAFNDTKRTQHQQVINLIDRTITRLELTS